MQSIYMIIYYSDKKLKKKKRKKKIAYPERLYKAFTKNNIDLMSQAQRMHFLQDVFQMTITGLVSVINHHHIYELHLFWDTLYYIKCTWVIYIVYL